MRSLKRLASRLPLHWQQEIRRYRFRRMIRKGEFHAGEPEFDRLSEWIRPGDWVLDIGANVGHYTLEMSRLVGPSGRVIAFEPVPETFSILVANLAAGECANVTALNVAVSDRFDLVTMRIPYFESGLENFYQSHIVLSADQREGVTRSVLTIRPDSFGLERPVALVKIDAEGHEPFVLNGMSGLVERDRPVLILESCTPEIDRWLKGLGYVSERMPDSPNRIYRT